MEYANEKIEKPDMEVADESFQDSESYDDDYIYENPKKPGFFRLLITALGISSVMNSVNRKHRKGRCNGDCAHCPPHYGYRYGRWYYGHHHDYGCEFGGNGGL